ncbi:hypothetical protein QZH45_09740 [Pseudomonas corrugata]|uniref:hypothetical protein n=1 Tax=Pseudomonas corrugata TaxID=47879 RepID=UPI003D812EEB
MNKGRGFLFCAATLMLLICSSAFGSGGEQAAPAEKTKCYGVTAYVMSGRFVRAKVHAPEAAQFPPYKATGVNIRELGPCQYAIDSYVDVRAYDGQMHRHYYTVTMQGDLNGDVWRAENLIIE